VTHRTFQPHQSTTASPHHANLLQGLTQCFFVESSETKGTILVGMPSPRNPKTVEPRTAPEGQDEARSGQSYRRDVPENDLEKAPTGENADEAGAFAEDSEEISGEAQPEAEDGVQDDMGTLALHPGHAETLGYPGTSQRHVAEPPIPTDLTPEQIEARRVAVSRGDFSLLTDAEVMLELRSGNMAAFDVLLAKYRKPIVHFMFRMVHNQAVAEELAQEVFLRIYRSRETYRAEARFSTWLYRIATNLGVNHARDTRHERTASTIYLDEPDSETGTTPDVPDSTPSAEAGMLRRERMNAIRQHVMALPERQKTAVLMHKYEGMDYKQIGEVLKLSESATKSLLFRAYQTLREKLKDFV
jgi:RNA polymerase sigma-70 factor (ECF subfamily)